MRGIGGRRAASAMAAFALVAIALLDTTPAGAMVRGVSIDARVDGQQVRKSSEIRPLRLSPKGSALVVVEVTNNTDRPIDIRIVRLEGKLFGLTFFAYDTAVAMTVAPGAKGSRRFPLDLGGVNKQATGLMPSSVKLLDAHRKVVAEESGVADVRGSLLSVYGLFGIGVALVTVISFLGALIGLARHRLPPDRWRRALRFMTPGIGLGLLLNFTLSATRVFVPGIGRWLTIIVVSALVFFGLGYLTPPPFVEEEEESPAVPARPAPAPVKPQAKVLPPPPPPPIRDLPAEPEPEVPAEAPDLASAGVLDAVEAEPVEAPAPPTEVVPPSEPPPPEPSEDPVPEPTPVAQPDPQPDPQPPPPEPTPEPAPPTEVADRLPIVVPCHLPPEDGHDNGPGDVTRSHPFPAPPPAGIPPIDQ